MSHKILSIDIRDESISAILIVSGIKGNRIESHIHIRLEPETPDLENNLYPAIFQLSEKIDVTGSTCILSVPPSEITYRNVTVPFKERKKIEQVLPFELESSLPCAIEEFTIDFDIVRKSDYTDVIAAAVNTERVNETVEILKSFGINPKYITAAPVAEAMCLAGAGPLKGGNFLFISIDDTCATACLICSGQLYLARTFMLPRTGLDYRARKLKKEILRILAAFESIYVLDFQFDHLLISCTGMIDIDSEMAVYVTELEKTFKMDVSAVDMLKDAHLKIASLPEGNFFDQKVFNSALGLAGIEIGRCLPFDFCRDHHVFQKFWNDNKKECITTGLLVVFVFVLVMANALTEMYFLQNQVRKVDNEILAIFTSTLPGHTRIIDPQQQLKVEIEQIRQKSQLSRNSGINIANIDILNAISRSIPASTDVLIGSMTRSENNVAISGTVDTFNAVDEMKGQLEKVDIFERITISSANMDNSINRVRFRIRVDLAGI